MTTGEDIEPLPKGCGALAMILNFPDAGIPNNVRIIKTMLMAGDIVGRMNYVDPMNVERSWNRSLTVPSTYVFYGDHGYELIANGSEQERYLSSYVETKKAITIQLTNFALGVERFQFEWINKTDFIHPDISSLEKSSSVSLNGRFVFGIRGEPYASEMAYLGYTDTSHLLPDIKVSNVDLLIYDEPYINSYTFDLKSLEMLNISWNALTLRIDYLDEDGYRRIWEQPLSIGTPLNTDFAISMMEENN